MITCHSDLVGVVLGYLVQIVKVLLFFLMKHVCLRGC
jgi:hypothetical protein